MKLATKHEAADFLGISPTTLPRYRKEFWIEGAHFIRLNSRNIKYNLELIEDWVKNKDNPSAHQKQLEKYARSA